MCSAARVLYRDVGSDRERRGRRGGMACPTFADVVRSFLCDLMQRVERGDASPLTLRAYEKALRRGPMAAFGSLHLDIVSTADVLAMRDSIAGARVLNTRNRSPGGPAAANASVLVTRMVFTHAARLGLWVGENPARHVRRLRVPNERNPITSTAGRRLAAACWASLIGDEQKPVKIASAYFLQVMATGARRSEVARMRISDFDRADRCVRILGKGGVARSCILSPEAVRLNETIVAQRWDDVWMFPGAKLGCHIKDPLKAWRRLCDRLGLEHYRIHDVRHGFAEAAHAACGDLKTVQKLLGHASIATTSRYVGHVSREIQEPVVNAVALALMGEGRLLRVRPS